MNGGRKFKLGVGAIAWTNPGIRAFADDYTGDEILAEMAAIFHHHAATPVEKRSEIDELMLRTDPELVSLLLDTGHARYGGVEPIELLRRFGGRIRYVHLKDVRRKVLAKVNAEGLGFRQAVEAGVFTVPGDGDLDFAPIVKYLLDTGFDSWALIEAEQNPVAANPRRYQRMGKQHIEQLVRRCGG